MKATLEFNLDDLDERQAHLRCVNAEKMAFMLWNINETYCRMINGKASRDDLVTLIREKLNEIDINEMIS